MPREWSSRFKLYARSQGMSPEDVLERDREKWSGCMTGFILWNGEMLSILDKELREKLRPAPGVYLRATHDIVACNMTPEQVDDWIAERIGGVR